MSGFSFDRKFLVNTMLSAASMASIQGVLAFLIYPLLSARLGVSRFGYFMLALSFTNFVIPVIAGAFANSLMRQHREISPEEKGGFWLAGAGLVFVVGLFFTAVLWAFSGALASRWNLPELSIWLPLLTPSMVGTMLYYNLRLGLIARGEFRRMVLCDSFYGAGLLVFAAMIYFLPVSDRFPLWMALAPLLSGTVISVHLFRRGDLSFSGLRKNHFRKILAPSSVYVWGIAAAWVMRMGDRWILGESGLPGGQIAYYTVAIQASFLVLFPLEHVSVVLMSQFSNVGSLEEIPRKQLRRYFAALFGSMAALMVGGPILGYIYIRLLFGASYIAVALPVLLITNSALVIYLFQMFGRGIIVRFRHPATDPVVSTIFAALSMAAAWLLMPHYGVIGVALGRNLGFAGVGICFFFICQWSLVKRAINPRRETHGISQLPAGRSAGD